MRVSQIEPLEDKAEGTCCGFPYDTQLASSAGCSIHFWVGDTNPGMVRLQQALAVARRHRDIVSATWSLGQPTKFWAHQDMN